MPADMKASGLDDLLRHLELAPDEVVDRAERIVGQGCNNIKKDAQRRVRGLAHLPHLARSFDYDVSRRGYVVTGEAGANRAKLQGKLDVFIEYGTPTSAPLPHWGPALDAEGPRFEKAIEAAAAEVLG